MRSLLLGYASFVLLWSVLASGQSLEPSGTGSNLQSTIMPAPATTPCPPCQVLVSAGDGGMSRVFWSNSTLGVTLDTGSVVDTQFNSTAITRTTTVLGDVNTLDPRNITEVQDLRYSFDSHQYPGQPGIILVNDTKGVVEGNLRPRTWSLQDMITTPR
ncbi:hypothetical protein XPA_001461 [Xanthoria parietina]